ncbi:MAG: hypothetical protein A2Z21_02590 [Candidatus Fraserbacteria bacterium RBG_16_55_9]|uniref:Right handed beta helix domain-containing protein n=1 Tax=Fraserbacteria sp. (strain RBG_16_55_9) TaxID=1817864 RepID=A0A1F5V0B0_FRAXR|nr:MAG: hypothetical protein A2Z21_02590 [Candidatus Fraserbacteria bacterium RBG_16_55_9]
MERIRFLLIAAVLSSFLVLSGGGGRGSQPEEPFKTFVVCPEGSPNCQFSKIDEAIQAAGADDLILLRPGTYKETLIFEKPVRLVATETGRVRIQGMQPGRPTITLKTSREEDLRVTLEGVIISGGSPINPTQACFDERNWICPDGVALSGEGSVAFTLVDSQITQANTGILCPWTLHSEGSARLILLNSRFSENVFGMYLDGCDFQEVNLTLEQATFAGNQLGVLIDQLGRKAGRMTVEIEESRFAANGNGLTANLRIEGSKLTIRNSWFLDNVVGIGSTMSSTTEIRTSRFIGNRIGLQLGHLLIGEKSGSILLEDSVVAYNIERGLYILSSSWIELRNNLIQGNGSGIVIFRADNLLSLVNNSILHNHEWGVALFRSPCVENPPTDPRFIDPIFIQGEGNEIRENGKGDLCPEDYNWPPNFQKQP